MINIVHTETHYDDQRKITSVKIKLKAIKGDDYLSGHPLAATVSASFFKTTLLTDVGQSMSMEIDPERQDIVDIVVSLKEENNLTRIDVAKFVNAFQDAIDETKLF